MTTHIPQPPATETAPDAIRCAPVPSAAHVSAAGSTSESRAADLLAELRDVSRLREARMAELERVRALRGAR
jgi:hypothetical protein